MNPVTRRWCLLAIAGAPVVLGLSAQSLSVRLENDYLRVSAPNLKFLAGKPLQRLRDGNTVGYLGQLTISTGKEGPVQVRSVAHFAISHDIWEEMDAGYRVTLITPGMRAKDSAKKLSAVAAQAWCLDQLKIDLTYVPADRPIWLRLEVRSEDPKETAGIIGAPGISLSGLIELFSRPVKDQQIHLIADDGPFKIADLRKPRS